MDSLITLTTDFGLGDGYVGAIKGVIYTINPAATVVDLSHEVAAQNVAMAAFVLYRAYRFFPPHAIHLAVVDPGVGSDRRCLLLETPHGRFIGPDNGILSYIYLVERHSLRADREQLPFAVSPFDLEGLADDPLLPLYELKNPAYSLATVSNTFHGRDIFAPAAAHLSLGVPGGEFGPAVLNPVLLPNLSPQPEPARQRLVGQVIHIDRFGNLISNLHRDQLARLDPDFSHLRATVGRDNVFPIHHTYAAVEEGALLGLVGSELLLELAARNGSAARRLGVRVGDALAVYVAHEGGA